MNPKVSGKLSVFNFIRIIEEEMKRTNDRISAERKRETRAVEGAKNRLLSVELKKLLEGEQGVLGFLDNCESVVRMTREADALVFVRLTISPMENLEWKRTHRDMLAAVANILYHRLHPGGQIARSEVLKLIPSWAFQVPPDPEVRIGPSQTRLSLVNQGPRKSYVALRERLECQYGCPQNLMVQSFAPRDLSEQNEDVDATKTVVRVSTKKVGNETIREIEIGEEEWEMFKKWMEEREK